MNRQSLLTSPTRRLATGLLAIALLPSMAQAIILYDETGGDGYSAPRHLRFYEGPDRDFLGDQLGLDLTGVSRYKPPQDNLPTGISRFNSAGWATMISERHFITSHNAPAWDFDIDGDGVGDQQRAGVVFHGEDPVTGAPLSWTGYYERPSRRFYASDDLFIAQLTEAPLEWV